MRACVWMCMDMCVSVLRVFRSSKKHAAEITRARAFCVYHRLFYSVSRGTTGFFLCSMISKPYIRHIEKKKKTAIRK